MTKLAHLSGAIAAGRFERHMLFVLLGDHLEGMLAARLGEHQFGHVVVELGQVPAHGRGVVAV